MKNKIHGVFSLIIASTAILISAYFISKSSIALGTAFIILCGIIAVAILRLFCAKCPSRNNCGHVLPGLALKKLFKNVKPGPYSFVDISIFLFSVAIVVIIPQFWLYKNMPVFIVYWAMIIIAGIDIKFAVCTQCENGFCPSNRKFKGFFIE